MAASSAAAALCKAVLIEGCEYIGAVVFVLMRAYVYVL